MRSITLIAAIGALFLLAVALSAVPYQPNVGGYYSDQRTLFTNNIYSETGTTITLWGNYLPGAGTYALGSNSAPWNKVYSDTIIASYFSITGGTLQLNRLYTDTISPAATNLYMTGVLWVPATDSTTDLGSAAARFQDFYAKRAAINIITTDTARGILFRFTGNGYATDLTLTDSLSAVTGDFSGKLSVSTDASVGDSLYAARIYTPRLTASDSIKGVTGTFSGAVSATGFTGAAADSAIRAQRADSSDLADSSRQAAHAYVADSATVAASAHAATIASAVDSALSYAASAIRVHAAPSGKPGISIYRDTTYAGADSLQLTYDGIRFGNAASYNNFGQNRARIGRLEVLDYLIAGVDSTNSSGILRIIQFGQSTASIAGDSLKARYAVLDSFGGTVTGLKAKSDINMNKNYITGIKGLTLSGNAVDSTRWYDRMFPVDSTMTFNGSDVRDTAYLSMPGGTMGSRLEIGLIAPDSVSHLAGLFVVSQTVGPGVTVDTVIVGRGAGGSATQAYYVRKR